MSETLENVTPEAGKRPVFLTVLCILSFIAAGFGIIGMLIAGGAKGVAQSRGMDINNNISNELATMPGADPVAIADAQAVMSWPYIITASILIIIGLIGVIQMWKLKKTGFYIYTATQIVGIIVPIIFGISFSAFGAVMAIAFIVMYGVNLKAMR